MVSEHSPSCRDSSHRKEEIRTQEAGVEFRSEWDERTERLSDSCIRVTDRLAIADTLLQHGDRMGKCTHYQVKKKKKKRES